MRSISHSFAYLFWLFKFFYVFFLCSLSNLSPSSSQIKNKILNVFFVIFIMINLEMMKNRWHCPLKPYIWPNNKLKISGKKKIILKNSCFSLAFNSISAIKIKTLIVALIISKHMDIWIWPNFRFCS